MREIGVAYRKNEKHVWRYAFQQYVVKFLRRRAETLRLKLSGNKKTKTAENGKNALNRETQKNYPGEYKGRQLGRSRQAWSKIGKRKQAGHVFKKNSLSVADKVLRVLREGKKRVFDMGKVSHNFQNYL